MMIKKLRSGNEISNVVEQRVPAFSQRKTQYEKQPKAHGNSNWKYRTDKMIRQAQG